MLVQVLFVDFVCMIGSELIQQSRCGDRRLTFEGDLLLLLVVIAVRYTMIRTMVQRTHLFQNDCFRL